MARRPVALACTFALMLPVGLPGAQAATGVKLTSVDKVYAQAGKSLAKLGVYHLKTRTTRTEGTSTVVSTEEDWVDVARAVARTYSVFDVHAKGADRKYNTSTVVLASNIYWSNGGPASPPTCHHAAPTVSILLGCPFSNVKDDSSIVSGRYQGRSVPVLVVHTTDYGDYATVKATTSTYLDPTTDLPLASIQTGTSASQKAVLCVHSTTTFHSNVLPRASLPKTFFSAAALGWKVPNPLIGLPHGIPVYWPGRTWSPGGGLPGLTLQSVQRLTTVGYTLYQEILEYALTSDPYGPTVLSLQLWKAEDWAAAKTGEPVPLCKPVSEVTLAIGKVTFRCPDDGVDGLSADVDAPGAHILVGAPSWQDATGHITFSPFSSIARLEALLNALKVRP